jgi:hypothetical protein
MMGPSIWTGPIVRGFNQLSKVLSRRYILHAHIILMIWQGGVVVPTTLAPAGQLMWNGQESIGLR